MIADGSPADEGFADVQVDLDGGRAVNVRLRSGWRDRIPSALLGLAVTTELAKAGGQAAAPDRPTMPDGLRGDASLPEELARLQRVLTDQLSALVTAPDATALGTRVSSRNGQVVATLLVGRIIRLEIDSAWADRVAVSEVADGINDCLARANQTLDQALEGSGEDQRAMRRLAELGFGPGQRTDETKGRSRP